MVGQRAGDGQHALAGRVDLLPVEVAVKLHLRLEEPAHPLRHVAQKLLPNLGWRSLEGLDEIDLVGLPQHHLGVPVADPGQSGKSGSGRSHGS